MIRSSPPEIQTPSAEEPPVLARISSADTLEGAYSAWRELLHEQARAAQSHSEERARLEREGHFVLGAVKAAVTPSALAADASTSALDSPLHQFTAQAESRLRVARDALEKRAARDVDVYARALSAAETHIEKLVQRYAALARPKLVVVMRPVAHSRAVLHVLHPGADASLILLYWAIGKIASRYGFLADDASDSLTDVPPTFYVDAGVTPEATRPSPADLPVRLAAFGKVAPIKGFLPMPLRDEAGGTTFYRLLLRGSVLEAELLDGDTFRSVLNQSEAERLAGTWLRWKFEGRLDVELRTE